MIFAGNLAEFDPKCNSPNLPTACVVGRKSRKSWKKPSAAISLNGVHYLNEEPGTLYNGRKGRDREGRKGIGRSVLSC